MITEQEVCSLMVSYAKREIERTMDEVARDVLAQHPDFKDLVATIKRHGFADWQVPNVLRYLVEKAR